MRGSELRRALTSGRRVYGINVEGFGHPRWPKFFADLGLDFVFMDTEHSPNNRETVAWAAQTYAAFGIAPLLRIPEPSPPLAAMGIDAGAHGIIAPYVETVAQVKGLVGAVKYRPLKGEALELALNRGQFPNPETAAYLENFNPDAVLVIMIESPAGVHNLPALLDVGGVDAVLMGPHDLSISHGVPEQYDHPVFVQAAQEVIRVCRSRQVGVGIHYISGSIERAIAWARWGCNLISHRATPCSSPPAFSRSCLLCGRRWRAHLPTTRVCWALPGIRGFSLSSTQRILSCPSILASGRRWSPPTPPIKRSTSRLCATWSNI